MRCILFFTWPCITSMFYFIWIYWRRRHMSLSFISGWTFFILLAKNEEETEIARGAETEHDFGTIMKNNCEPVHTARVIKLVTCTNLCLNAYNQNVWDQLVNCARRACQWQWVLKQVNARKWNSKWILRSRGADIINFRSLSCNPTSKTKKWKKKETRTAVVCMAGGAYSTQSIAQWVHSP